MIAVVKPAAPSVLLDRGAAETAALCAAYEAGTRAFAFKSNIYADDQVKLTLRDAQRRKCAFCESYFAHTSYGDIEHYRPKAGYKQRASDPLRQPGYYWLAYVWENLFYSCQLCNQQFKRNLFPLRDGKKRIRSHLGDLTREAPLLLYPGSPTLALHIGFNEEYACAVGDSPEGKATIDLLALNREELVLVRRARLRHLRDLLRLARLLRDRLAVAVTPTDQADLIEVEARLAASRADEAEYAAMARAYLDRLATDH